MNVRSDPESDNTTKGTDSAWNTNAKEMLIFKKACNMQKIRV